jgi:hypothetical protein
MGNKVMSGARMAKRQAISAWPTSSAATQAKSAQMKNTLTWARPGPADSHASDPTHARKTKNSSVHLDLWAKEPPDRERSCQPLNVLVTGQGKDAQSVAGRRFSGSDKFEMRHFQSQQGAVAAVVQTAQF